MSRRLDEYLLAVGRELPAARRESELREMRSHLEAIVARLVEGGASEEEATEAAIAQFGAARRVGGELRRANEKRGTLGQILGAPALGMACLFVWNFVPLAEATAYVVLPEPFDSALFFLTQWPAALSAGAVAGSFAPRWGGRLLLLAMGLFHLSSLPLLLSIAEVNNSVPVMLLAANSGVFLGARWASRYAQRRTDAQRT